MKDTAQPRQRVRSDAHRVLVESGEVLYLRLRDATIGSAEPMQAPPDRAPAAVYLAAERRRLERDLHDGVQNELVALIVKLALVQEDPSTTGARRRARRAGGARTSALDSTRAIVRGIYPPLLTAFGLTEALRAQARRAAIHVSIVGTASRSTEKNEEAGYFCCSEAIQNAAKHAGCTAKIKLRLHDHDGTLAVHVADDGRGFDPAHTADGAGLRNIRERIADLGGSFKLDSRPGRGTVLTISLRWPTRS